MKAKIILASVALLSLVGGVMAFKIRQERIVFKDNVNQQCLIETTLSVKFEPTGPNKPTNTRLSPLPTTDPCPFTRTVADL